MKKLVVIAGPTASGKTSLAIDLARHYHTEIISADSRQFYRQMSIGTAKPEEHILKEIPHHFINSIDVSEKYNIGRFETDALHLTEELFKKHDIVLLAGGSGLYIDALCQGIDTLPESVPELRDSLNKILEAEGPEAIRQRIRELDPEHYETMDVNNPHRLLRALEVMLITGKKFSELRKGSSRQRNFVVKKIGLLLDRDELYDRINSRVDDMIKGGLIEEVKSLYKYRNENALQTVGYKEIFDYIDGKCTLEAAIAQIKQNTRNYAKRQMTWFRKDANIRWFSPDEKEKIISFIDE